MFGLGRRRVSAEAFHAVVAMAAAEKATQPILIAVMEMGGTGEQAKGVKRAASEILVGLKGCPCGSVPGGSGL